MIVRWVIHVRCDGVLDRSGTTRVILVCRHSTELFELGGWWIGKAMKVLEGYKIIRWCGEQSITATYAINAKRGDPIWMMGHDISEGSEQWSVPGSIAWEWVEDNYLALTLGLPEEMFAYTRELCARSQAEKKILRCL